MTSKMFWSLITGTQAHPDSKAQRMRQVLPEAWQLESILCWGQIVPKGRGYHREGKQPGSYKMKLFHKNTWECSLFIGVYRLAS